MVANSWVLTCRKKGEELGWIERIKGKKYKRETLEERQICAGSVLG